MVIAAGIAANLVLKPIIIRIGAINSPITVKNNEGVLPTPKGFGNSKLPSNKF
jgi:hypothetical protein